jgi:hypothetical protein
MSRLQLVLRGAKIERSPGLDMNRLRVVPTRCWRSWHRIELVTLPLDPIDYGIAIDTAR